MRAPCWRIVDWVVGLCLPLRLSGGLTEFREAVCREIDGRLKSAIVSMVGL